MIREGDVGLAHEYMGTAVERRKTWCEQNLQRVYKMKGKELARCFEKVITRAKVGMVEG